MKTALIVLFLTVNCICFRSMAQLSTNIEWLKPKKTKAVGVPRESCTFLSKVNNSAKFSTAKFTDPIVLSIATYTKEGQKSAVNKGVFYQHLSKEESYPYEVMMEEDGGRVNNVKIFFPKASMAKDLQLIPSGKSVKYKYYRKSKSIVKETAVPIMLFYEDDEKGSVEQRLSKQDSLVCKLNIGKEEVLYKGLGWYSVIYYIYSDPK